MKKNLPSSMACLVSSDNEYLNALRYFKKLTGLPLDDDFSPAKYMEHFPFREDSVKYVGYNNEISIGTWSGYAPPLKLLFNSLFELRNAAKQGFKIPVEEIHWQIKVVLNDHYTALIDKNDVKVGCQTFSHDKILEVAAAINKLKKK